MERRKTQSISDALSAFIGTSSLETPLLQYRAIQNWASVVPQAVARMTAALEIRGGELIVRVDSPALATELQMQREVLTRLVNASVKAQVISDIRFVL